MIGKILFLLFVVGGIGLIYFGFGKPQIEDYNKLKDICGDLKASLFIIKYPYYENLGLCHGFREDVYVKETYFKTEEGWRLINTSSCP